jgi:Predicted integral membrane protein
MHSMTVPQRYYVGAAGVILATLLGTIVAYPQLPKFVPVHWDAHGNSWGPKWSLFLYTPGLMLGILLMFVALPWLSPKKFKMNSFRPTNLYILVMIVALLAYSQLLVLSSGLGWEVDADRALAGGVCLLIALFGNVVSKMQPNFVIGVRTPWTLGSEPVWQATHRFAAKTLVAGGMLALVGMVLNIPLWLPVATILLALFTPAVYSLICYRQLERTGALS